MNKAEFLKKLEKHKNVAGTAKALGMPSKLVNQMVICWDIYPTKIEELKAEGRNQEAEQVKAVLSEYLKKNRKRYPEVSWEGFDFEIDTKPVPPYYPNKNVEREDYPNKNVEREDYPNKNVEREDYEISTETEEEFEENDYLKGLEKESEELEKKMMQREQESLKKEIELNKEIDTLKEKMKDMAPIPPKPVPSDKKGKKGNIVIPEVYPKILALAKARMNIVLVGPTGCGKTTIAEQLAKDLKLPFSSISLSSGTTEGHLGGRLLPAKGGEFKYFLSECIQTYEKGGLMLFDEMDAADSNTLVFCNSMLSNNRCSVPNRTIKPFAIRHKDFVGLGAMNTFGNGADRMFVGRNQLDEATLDRFRVGMVYMDYDPRVEKEIIREDILEWGLRIREKIKQYQMRKSMSTRFMKDLSIMANTSPEYFGRPEDWFETFTRGWKEDEIRKIGEN